MNKLLKKGTLLLASVLMVLGLVACGAPKTTPTEVVSLYMNALTQQDFTALNEYTGLTESTADFYAGMEEGFTSSLGMDVDEAKKKELLTSMLHAFSKITYETIDENINGKTATVTLEIYGIDFDKVLENAQTDMLGMVSAGAFVSEDEIMNSVLDLMIKHLNNPAIVSTPTPVTLVLAKVSNKWVIEDEQQLEELMTSGLLKTSLM